MGQDLQRRERSRGFTLIEMAIVVLIAGVILAAAAKFVLPIFERARQVETSQKMRLIAEAMDAYALRNFRIPCPADPRTNPVGTEPFAAERFSGPDGDTVPANCGAAPADWTGVVPATTLGLSRNVMKDGWGRYFTYAVTPAFALDVSTAGGGTDILVHPVCRTLAWFYLGSGGTAAPRHRNPRKARFCCPADAAGGNNVAAYNGATADLRVRAPVNGTLQPVLADPNPRQATGLGAPAVPACPDCTQYRKTDTVFTLTPNVVVPPADVSTGIAYVLLSHGSNGFGAFAADGSRPGQTSGGPDEDTNATNNTRNYVERPEASDSATDGYDDILVWKTQDLMFAEQGESCVLP